MEEVGIVDNIEGVMARVKMERQSACDKCTENTCVSTGNTVSVDALNLAKAEVGQKVRVTTKPLTYLQGSVLIYGIPAIALIVGAIFGRVLLDDILKGVDPDLLSAICGFSALLISLFLVKFLSRNMEKKPRNKPVIVEIIEDS